MTPARDAGRDRPMGASIIPFAGPVVLGLAGRAGAGKSTVAAILAGRHGFVRLRFAGPLKAMMRAIGLDDDALEGAGKERPHPLLAGRSPRHAMQTLGTEWGRRCIGEDLWCVLARDAALRAMGGNPAARIVFEDVRFANEADTVARLGGLVVRVERPGLPALADAAAAHESEAGLAAHHLRLMNDGPPELLAARVAGTLARIARRAAQA